MARLLSIGMQGGDVADLQTKLNAWPSALARLIVDGTFGNLTRQRVMKFQNNKQLAVDGIAGPQTMAALNAPQPSNDDTDNTEFEQYYYYAAYLIRHLPGNSEYASRFSEGSSRFFRRPQRRPWRSTSTCRSGILWRRPARRHPAAAVG